MAMLLVPLAAAAVAGLVLLWPSGVHPPAVKVGQVWVQGTITATKLAAAAPTGGKGAGATDTTTNELTVRITGGPTKGAVVKKVVGVSSSSPRYAAGDDVVLTYSPTPVPDGSPDDQYEVRDFQRGPPLASLAIVFALVVVVIGRWRGLGAIVALGVSFLLLVKFMLPAIISGKNAVEVAAVAAAVILFVALYATHGLSVRTSVAVLGTGISLALIGVLGTVTSGLAHITGLGNDDAAYVAGQYAHVDIRGLLLAGVIVGALGVLNDVTVTQVSAVWELKQADPTLGVAGLFRAGMRIGRDHIGSTVNTLVLAYAGASLPLFVLMSNSGQSWSGSGSAEVVAEEIVRTLVGSIGLAAAVPITTGLAAWFAAGEADAAALTYSDLHDGRGGREARTGRASRDREIDRSFGHDRSSGTDRSFGHDRNPARGPDRGPDRGGSYDHDRGFASDDRQDRSDRSGWSDRSSPSDRYDGPTGQPRPAPRVPRPPGREPAGYPESDYRG
jgi:uncharacterized membrane protein